MIRELWTRQRDGIISLTVLVGIFIFILMLALEPLFTHIESYRVELAKDARILQQLRALDGARDNLEAAFAEYQEKGLQDWVYSKQRPDAVTLDIQRHVSAELANTDAQVSSISSLSVKLQDGYSTVGVQVNFTSSMLALLEVLEVLEQSKPLLVLDSIRISPVRQTQSRDGVLSEQSVSVQMTVFTFLVDANGLGGAQ